VASTFALFIVGNRVLEAHNREQLRHQGIAHLDRLQSVLKDAETVQRGFIITGDETYSQSFEQSAERLPGELEKIRSFPWADISLEEIARIGQLADRRMSQLRSTIQLRRSGGVDAATSEIQAGSGKQLMDEIRTNIDRLKERQIAGLKIDRELSDQATRTRTFMFIGCGILSIAVLSWTYQRIAEAAKQREA